ncbi:G2-specific protein kinase [Venturia nashicola]|nr:G2-specific protein kinase [Venturia nashicola]
MYTVEVVNERETSGPSPRRTMQRSKTGRCEYASMNERSLDQVSRPRTTPYDRLEAVGDVSPVTSHHRGGVWRLSRKSSGSERAPEDGVDEGKRSVRSLYLRPFKETGGIAFVRPETGGIAFVRPDTEGIAFVRPDTGGIAFVRPDTGGIAFVRPETGGIAFVRPDTEGIAFVRFLKYKPKDHRCQRSAEIGQLACPRLEWLEARLHTGKIQRQSPLSVTANSLY